MARMDKLSTYRTTWETRANGGSVTYVSTRIVSWDDAGNVTLDSGGWQTVTTKRKMVQAARQFGLSYGVYQRKGEWFVDIWNPKLGEYGGWMNLDMPFHDGMTFNPRALRLARNAELAVA